MNQYNGWEIGPKLREYRKSKGISVDKLSEISEMSISHIRQIEQGNRRITIDTLYKLMDALETDANTILSINLNPETSVDAALEELPAQKRKYLNEVFMFMIRNADKAS